MADTAKLTGRITVFSISGCPHCRRAKNYIKEKHLDFTEINLDIYPSRRPGMVEITGRYTVPQIFFNEEHVGGCDDLLGLSEEKFNALVEKVKKNPPGEGTPPLPVKTDDDGDTTKVHCEEDKLILLSEKMRSAEGGVGVKDRKYHLRTYYKCFVGSTAVDWLVANSDEVNTREEAIALGNTMMDAHIFHHVCYEHEFKDEMLYYRFLRDQKSKALNANYETSCEPRPATEVAKHIRRLILELYDQFLSADGNSVDYEGLSKSDLFELYCKDTAELKRVDVVNISRQEKLAFFINIYNALVIHATVLMGAPKSSWQRKKFFTSVSYIIGGHPYTLNDIENGVLRANRRPPYAWSRQFSDKSDPRLPVCLDHHEPRIHFALVCGAKSCPPIKTYSAADVEDQLTAAAQAFFESDNLVVNERKKTVSLSKIIDWYKQDFGRSDADVIAWIASFAPAEVSAKLLQFDKNWKISYQTYDWTSNAKK